MLTTRTLQGHRALWLENDFLRIAVLPDKGADICELVHKPSGVDFLMHTPQGLRPPGPRPPADFLENYEGGWQVLFPSGGDACTHHGRPMPFHGEVAVLPWEWAAERDDGAETALCLGVRCRLTPFRLERTLRLRQGEAALSVEQRITNESPEPAEFVYGEHLVLGGGFLESGCRLEVPARTLYTPDPAYEPATSRLAPGQREPWPLARGIQRGERIDLRHIPGPEAHSHDDVTLGDLASGEYAVTNPRLGLRFRLEWDARLFPYITFWLPYGGPEAPPLTGIYGVGLEPWTSRYNLEQAMAHGEAVRLPGGESLTTAMRATVARI